jgi:serine/threonine protein kinase
MTSFEHNHPMVVVSFDDEKEDILAVQGHDELIGQDIHITKPGSSSADDVVKMSLPPVANTSFPHELEQGGDAAITVGKYLIYPKVIGSGRQGQVRECIHKGTGHRYAVKSILKRTVDPRAISLEVSLLRQIQHPSIIQLVDVQEDEEHVHLITELCTGGELYDRIIDKLLLDSNHRRHSGRPRCFTEDATTRIIYEVLSAVTCMHDNGIVHRDIKTENILFQTLDDDDNAPIKIIDFGLSRVHYDNDEPMSIFVGSAYYVAPEVLLKKYDKSCDVWSIGIITYIMLSGTPPFNGNTDDDIHTSILRGVMNWDPKDWSGISCEAIDFIQRVLQVDPKQRLTARQALQHPWMVNSKHARMMKARQDHELLQDRPMKEICMSNGNTFHRHDCVSSSNNKLGTSTSCNESKSSPSRPLSLRGLADNNNNNTTMSCSSCTRTTYHPPYYNIDPTNRRGTLDTVCSSELDMSERSSSVHVHQILDSSETSIRVLEFKTCPTDIGILRSANTRKRLTI